MNETQMTIPHLFRCPISLDLFTDPVTLCTGQTYDRSSIEKWLAAGNLTCPVTMQKLQDPSLVPNHTLRHLIQQWRQMGHQVDPDYLTTIDPLAAMKHNLESHEATFENKRRTLDEIRVLSEGSPSTNSRLLQLGFLPLLLHLLFGKVELEISREYSEFAEKALCYVLRLLPLGEMESLKMLRDEESALDSFLFLFENGNISIKKSMCHLVEAVSSYSETKEICALMGKNQRFLRGIFSLVHQSTVSETSDAGIRAISALCCLEQNRERLVQEGVTNAIIKYILNAERRERSLAAVAMGRLEQLLVQESAMEAVINNPNGIISLVKMVFRVSDHEGSESAVNCLMVICHGSLQAREKAIGAGVLTQLLLLLQSQCSGRTKTKARMLLKLLRSKFD